MLACRPPTGREPVIVKGITCSSGVPTTSVRETVTLLSARRFVGGKFDSPKMVLI